MQIIRPWLPLKENLEPTPGSTRQVNPRSINSFIWSSIAVGQVKSYKNGQETTWDVLETDGHLNNMRIVGCLDGGRRKSVMVVKDWVTFGGVGDSILLFVVTILFWEAVEDCYDAIVEVQEDGVK